jgi:hypothetical protein
MAWSSLDRSVSLNGRVTLNGSPIDLAGCPFYGGMAFHWAGCPVNRDLPVDLPGRMFHRGSFHRSPIDSWCPFHGLAWSPRRGVVDAGSDLSFPNRSLTHDSVIRRIVILPARCRIDHRIRCGCDPFPTSCFQAVSTFHRVLPNLCLAGSHSVASIIWLWSLRQIGAIRFPIFLCLTYTIHNRGCLTHIGLSATSRSLTIHPCGAAGGTVIDSSI